MRRRGAAFSLTHTKNARLNNEDRIAEVLIELINVHWDVICFTETRAESNILQLEDGHILYCTGTDGESTGALVLIHSRHAQSKLEIFEKLDRIIAVDIVFDKRKYLVISAYMPHDGFGEDALHAAYQELDKMIDQAKNQERRLLIGGDFQCDPDDLRRGSFLQSWARGHGLIIAKIEVSKMWVRHGLS